MSAVLEAREAWAEMEARSFEKTAEAIEESAEQWRTMLPHHERTHMATICLLKAEVWRDAARQLRQPKAIRLERKDQPQ